MNFSGIAELINHAYKKYNCDKKVILSGGITRNKEIMRNIIKNKVNSDIELIFPDMPQIYGACRMCCNFFSITGDNFEENFRDDYFNIVKVGEKNA